MAIREIFISVLPDGRMTLSRGHMLILKEFSISHEKDKSYEVTLTLFSAQDGASFENFVGNLQA